MNDNIFISVVIPIFNSENFLDKLLNSLSDQTLLDNKFEVILIDNNSNDNTKEIISDFISTHKIENYHYLFFNKRQSSYAARNYGIKKSKGNILAFSDSDCILDKDWLSSIYNCYNEDGKAEIISGSVEIIIEDKQNMWEQYDKIVHLDNERYSKMNSAATANLSLRKKVFYDVGEFKEVVSGEDGEWTSRAIDKGYKLQYLQNIKVFHPSRKTFKEIKKKSNRIAFGKGQKIKFNDDSFIKNLLMYFLRIFYISTNIKISKKLYSKISFNKIILFNFYFLNLRLYQLLHFYKGYKES